MARPRIFVSSTYYDLRHIRASLEAFIESLGYESVLYESGDVAFRHDKPLDDSCYREIQSCHMLLLIIGGRYGTPTSADASDVPRSSGGKKPPKIDPYEQYNSITRKEYQTAREREVPIFIFVDKNVYAEYQTFKKNRTNKKVNYAYVDSINIFLLLDEILAQHHNNFVQGFEKFDDISSWLRDQWAGIFADLLTRSKSDSTLADLSSQVSGLREVTSVLQKYTEEIIASVNPDASAKIISKQHQKLRRVRVARFNSEAMIRYIKNKTSDAGGVVLGSAAMYAHFLKSKSIEEFLTKIDAPASVIESVLTMHLKQAREDFDRLKSEFSDNPDLPDDDADSE